MNNLSLLYSLNSVPESLNTKKKKEKKQLNFQENGDALIELEQKLRSQKERLTPQEENIFQRCKSSALNQFTAGLIVGGGLVWEATWKLNRLLRVNLSSGAAIILGFWRFGNSLESSVDRILALDGTRMQSELANMYVSFTLLC
ncbi:uncharacterized protein LOC120135708 [Hibiscus syriacus]|uniref:uncharacterized protein LOC120135708 n=1 Tax=Hibiscus syriacus TaxID=106335 RepID=UPI0019250AD6|nr:uncharacterized protein LOC120135708 [Hibiscus syriacus]